MVETNPLPMCPMAAACKGMMEKHGSGLWLLVPGILFIALGVLIILYPQILARLIALAFIVMGIAALVMINFMRRIGSRFQ